MTVIDLIPKLVILPGDTKVISNSGWEGETNVDGIWYNEEIKEVHLTQGTEFELQNGYRNGFKLIYSKSIQ